MEAKKLALLCRKLADNKKAEGIVVLDVRKLSSVTDYFVIATATSEPHLKAIETERLPTLATEHASQPTNTEANAHYNWIGSDCFDVIVHLMRKDAPQKHDLQGSWRDAPQVKPPAPRARGGATR